MQVCEKVRAILKLLGSNARKAQIGFPFIFKLTHRQSDLFDSAAEAVDAQTLGTGCSVGANGTTVRQLTVARHNRPPLSKFGGTCNFFHKVCTYGHLYLL